MLDKFRIRLSCFLLVFALGACGFTAEGDILRTTIRDAGAKAADAELINVEWALCNAVSVGAIKRRYGNNSEKLKAWKKFCDG